MAGIFAVKDLEAKKRALAAESEVHRQALKLELQNLRLYAVRAQSKVFSFGRFNPMLMLVVSLAGMLMRRRFFSLPRLALTATVGWQLYNKIVPLCRGLFSPRSGRGRTTRSEAEEESAARF